MQLDKSPWASSTRKRLLRILPRGTAFSSLVKRSSGMYPAKTSCAAPTGRKDSRRRDLPARRLVRVPRQGAPGLVA